MDKKFILNTRSKTIHSVAHLTNRCQIKRINKDNIRRFFTESEVMAHLGGEKSYRKECAFCMPAYRKSLNKKS